MNNIINAKLKVLPDKPGVYIMKDSLENIIYVGKAKILKNRVRSYFRKNSSHTPKVIKMVENIHDFSWIVTDSEVEALILECNLIKRHRPKYNILLKDDKTFPYIKISVNEDFPRITVTRKTDDKQALYFGPYAGTVTKTVELLKKIYKIRDCGGDLSKHKGRECLNFHIGRCAGPCCGNITAEEYRKSVDKVIRFLEGKSDELIKHLKDNMNSYAAALEFEKASEARDHIAYIEKITEKQKISAPVDATYDIIGVFKGERNICVTVMFLRKGKLLGTKNSYFPPDNNPALVTEEFIRQFYRRGETVPSEILIPEATEETPLTAEYLSSLRGSSVNLHVPLKGKKKELVALACKNAEEGLRQKAHSKFDNALSELASLLSLDEIPERIEVYDISNTAGSDAVGFMTVFLNGIPAKEQYRKFRIKYVEGQNDYDCMYEVIYRRLMRYLEEAEKLADGADPADMKFTPLPDMILVDGGKGHVGIGKQAVSDAGLSIAVFGLVKDAKHRTRDITSDEREYGCVYHRAAFDLITRMQDETHNNAVKYHHYVRTTSTVKSDLMKIEGVGPATRKKLFEAFKTEEAIRKATVSELSEVVNEKTAKKVYFYFNHSN